MSNNDDIRKYHKLLSEGLVPVDETPKHRVMPGADADSLLQDLEDHLSEAISVAEDLARTDRSLAGQLQGYTIGWLRNFIEDRGQPGSVASLRRILDKSR